jgi:hypothetical protein
MKVKRIIFSLLISLAINSAAFSTTMHTILVINTEDKNIGCEYDLKNWQGFLPEITKNTAMKINLQVIKDKNWSEKTVSTAINSLTTADDDGILFYYSGHGFRFQEGQSDPWPWLALQNDTYKSLQSVYNELSKKKHRLLLVIADCCNNYVPDTAPKVSHAKTRSDPRLIAENYKKLFIKSNGEFIASGCIPGQFSFGGAPDGGAFTSTLIRTIRLSVNGSGPEWKKIFDDSTKPLIEGKQKPQYKMAMKSPGKDSSASKIPDKQPGGKDKDKLYQSDDKYYSDGDDGTEDDGDFTDDSGSDDGDDSGDFDNGGGFDEEE